MSLFVLKSAKINICADIAEKIENNGVKTSDCILKISPTDIADQVEGKIVGFCEAGQKKIIYLRLNHVSAEFLDLSSEHHSRVIECTKRR
ncbi:DUF1161 domain-containing protein [Gilliamella sp. B2717]|uniref:DUF1161 domain-containing protein n=1 Tax=Gilliamella sp. B2717 TaxID=2817996 RepID=UPI002269FE7C|nr:DUF1161 domain-containing protein [Gilliamella sp. B2717]MCX8579048.1 DUF1161 domain-containing protein [Gilliamella sp. B2717]